MLGFILSWYFTRYQVAEGYVRVNTGFLFRQQRQARLDRVQAIDIVQPLLARIFGLAELEVRSRRRRRIRGAAGLPPHRRRPAAARHHPGPCRRASRLDPAHPEAAAPEAPEQQVLQVPPSRLFGSLLLSEQTVFIVLGAAASVMLSALTENRAFFLYLIPAALGLVAAYWSSFNKGYNFTAAISPDGIRLRYGLLDTQAQTLPPGRIQALQVAQPPLWRLFGWYRMQVNVAGYGAAGNNGEGGARTTLLPVGKIGRRPEHAGPRPARPRERRTRCAFSTQGVNGLDSDGGFVTTPRRARLLAPLGWRRNGFAATDTALLMRSGRWWRQLVVVPHQRTQSIALQQGPLARRFGLADLVLHTTAGPVAPRLIQAGLGRGAGALRRAGRPRPRGRRGKHEHAPAGPS